MKQLHYVESPRCLIGFDPNAEERLLLKTIHTDSFPASSVTVYYVFREAKFLYRRPANR